MKKTFTLDYVTLVNDGYNNKLYIDGELMAEFTDTFENAKREARLLDREEHNYREDAFLTACGIYH